MPQIALLDGDGRIELSYEDTGPPGVSTTYVTVVLIHGLIFHGATFNRMFPYAASYNLRLVSVTMRDYPGSTAYTSSELDMLASSDYAIQESIIRKQGLEVAEFLKYLIETHRLPPLEIGAESRQGGIALLAWSLGNAFSMSMLGNVESLGSETRVLLEKYLRTVVVYDVPYSIVGGPPPEGVYHPLGDPTVPLEERNKSFMRWVAAYCEPMSDISSIDIPALRTRRDMHEISEDHSIQPTIDKMSAEEIESTTDPSVWQRSARYLRYIPRELYWNNTQRALFDTRGELVNVKGLILWCDMSPSLAVWGAKNLHDRMIAAEREGTRVRQLDMIKLSGANHFIHWEEPERMVRLLAQHL